MKRLALATLTACLLWAAPASAHNMTCSTSRLGHRHQIENAAHVRALGLVLYNKPNVRCWEAGRNHIRYIVTKGRYTARQDVFMVKEKTVPGCSFCFYGTEYRATPARLSAIG